jgi:hypothetical protein
MTEIETTVLMLLMFIQGLTVGYVLWAPTTPFKQGLVDGLLLKFLRSKK